MIGYNKDAFTLVELIFSIVIIAIVFTVVPKLMFVTTKTMEVSVKEDGLFAGISLLSNIVRLPWDENTIKTKGQIIGSSCSDVSTPPFYRVGGFLGSRNCLDYNGSAEWNVSPVMGQENGATDYNDIDDYNGYSTSTINGRNQYDLGVSVVLNGDIKEINATVSSAGKTKLCTSFFYYSANLGHIQINKRAW